VAFVTGAGGGLLIALGALIGGWICQFNSRPNILGEQDTNGTTNDVGIQSMFRCPYDGVPHHNLLHPFDALRTFNNVEIRSVVSPNIT